MTCREFQHQWDALLDADARVVAGEIGTTPCRSDNPASPAIDDGDEAMLAHAASCPQCRQLAAQWRTLRHAIRAWRQPPMPSAGLTDRILAARSVPQSLQWTDIVAVERRQMRRGQLVLAGALAASLLALSVLVRFLTMGNPAPVGREAKPPVIVSRDPDLHSVADPDGRHALDRALAEATSATWDLARSASEPAARISRDVLDATTGPEDAAVESTPDQPVAAVDRSEPGAVGLRVPVPSLDRLAPDATAASAVLQQVGDHLSAGVRPLSDTARHAFGFLIIPARNPPGSRSSPPSAKGA
jgi:hypothetical protein